MMDDEMYVINDMKRKGWALVGTEKFGDKLQMYFTNEGAGLQMLRFDYNKHGDRFFTEMYVSKSMMLKCLKKSDEMFRAYEEKYNVNCKKEA